MKLAAATLFVVTHPVSSLWFPRPALDSLQSLFPRFWLVRLVSLFLSLSLSFLLTHTRTHKYLLLRQGRGGPRLTNQHTSQATNQPDNQPTS